MGKIKITPPVGTYGLAVEPWTPGEVYAVAADWAEAACSVLSYGEDGWQPTGRQVADFRHSARAALIEEIRQSMLASGDYPSAAILKDIVAESVEIDDTGDTDSLD